MTSNAVHTYLRALLVIVLLGTVLRGFSYGEPLYVIDSLTITVRTGPSLEHKVIGTLDTGEKVELKERSGEWALVRHSGDKEGWVVARYLSPTPPSFLLVQRLQAEKKADGELIDALEKENAALKQDNKTLSAKLTEATRKFEELQEGAQGYLALRQEHEAAQGQLQALLSSNEQLALENQVLKDVTKIKWFLIGAGVLLGGLIVGFVVGRSRRKKKPSLTFSLKE